MLVFGLQLSKPGVLALYTRKKTIHFWQMSVTQTQPPSQVHPSCGCGLYHVPVRLEGLGLPAAMVEFSFLFVIDGFVEGEGGVLAWR